MQTSSVFRATSFSLALVALIVFEGCSASSQSENYPYQYQCFYDYATSRSSRPEFDATLFYSPDTSGQRLDVYITVKESRLKFEREGDTYHASYSSVVRLLQKDRTPVIKEADRVVRRHYYPESSDNSYDAFMLSFKVKSGEYSVEVSVTDDESKQRAMRVYQKDIPDVSDKSFALSDILLLARYDSLGEGRKITPFILSNVGLLSDTLKFFTAVLSPSASTDSIHILLYRLSGKADNLPHVGLQSYLSNPMRYDPCRGREDTTLVYSYRISATLSKGYSFIFGGVPKPPTGYYLLREQVKDEMDGTAVSSLGFQVHSPRFPDISDDLLEMVNSLNYIASSYEMKKIVQIRNDSAVKANLLKFWEDHGGYSKMAQYYQRVSQANRLFTSCTEGWKTPMGMFYIVCGAPDYVDCRSAWSERWFYAGASSGDSLVIIFKLTHESVNPDDRVYIVESVYSSTDLWSYHVNRWRTPY